jgi:hypothetical protein
MLSFYVQRNFIYFRTTDHYEALGQRDKPNVYACFKKKEGKQ